MSSTTDSSSLVTLLDPSVNSKTLQTAKIISLPHPSDNEAQEFIFLPRTAASNQPAIILQVQSFQKSYGSFLVGSRVISNGALHVATPVDPLFFVLEAFAAAPQKWQPLEQLLVGVPDCVQESISSPLQYKHLCCTNDQLGDDMILYKFQTELALAWLTKKFNAAKQVLLDQQQRGVLSGGAFTKTFHHVPDTPLDQSVLEQESCQVVCDFLSAEWTRTLMHQLNLAIISTPVTTTPKRQWGEMAGADSHEVLLEMTLGNVVSVEKAKQKEGVQKKLKAQTSGLKQLAKVKTKGMKSMSSFFSAKTT